MLRRKPTAITLTTEDIARYEDFRTSEAALADQAAQEAALQLSARRSSNYQSQSQSQNARQGSERERVKTREERLGISGAGR